MHEGIPILNYLVPKAFTHEDGRLTGVTLREGAAPSATRRAGASSCRPASPTCTPRATTCWSRSARRTPSPGSSATSASSSTSGACRWSTRRPCSRPARACSSAATPRSGPRTSSGPWRTATRRRSRSTSSAAARTSRQRPPPRVTASSARRWASTSGATTTTLATTGATACRSVDNAIALDRRQGGGRARLRPRAGAAQEAQRCLNCDVQTVFTDELCIECDACVDICPMDCITFTANGDGGRAAHAAERAPALEPDQDLYVSRRAEDRPRHGQGRGRLPALRPVRRALPDRRLGHAEVPSRHRPGRMPHACRSR